MSNGLSIGAETLSIPLSQGCTALVDAVDWYLLEPYDWKTTMSGTHKGRYPYATVRVKSNPPIYKLRPGRNVPGIVWDIIYMHRMLMEAPRGLVVDHINHNTLDNRRRNLRVCTTSQNVHNSLRPTNNTSGFIGVHKLKTTGLSKPFQSRIMSGGRYTFLGNSSTAEEAALLYNAAALKLHGEFAYLNAL